MSIFQVFIRYLVTYMNIDSNYNAFDLNRTEVMPPYVPNLPKCDIRWKYNSNLPFNKDTTYSKN